MVREIIVVHSQRLGHTPASVYSCLELVALTHMQAIDFDHNVCAVVKWRRVKIDSRVTFKATGTLLCMNSCWNGYRWNVPDWIGRAGGWLVVREDGVRGEKVCLKGQRRAAEGCMHAIIRTLIINRVCLCTRFSCKCPDTFMSDQLCQPSVCHIVSDGMGFTDFRIATTHCKTYYKYLGTAVGDQVYTVNNFSFVLNVLRQREPSRRAGGKHY